MVIKLLATKFYMWAFKIKPTIKNKQNKIKKENTKNNGKNNFIR